MNVATNILAVDDTTESLALLVKILTSGGYDVSPADSGELALAAVAARRPDLILLDVRMPGLGGLEVCRRLKAGEATRDIPIILISAFAEVKEWVEGLQQGAADYITKPFQPEELLLRVETHVSLHRAHHTLAQQAAELQQANEHLGSEIRERLRVEEQLQLGLAEAESSRQALLSILEDQQRSKEALHSSESRYRRLFEAAKDGILILDADTGKIVDVNPFMTALTGYSYEHFVDKHLWDIGFFKDVVASKVAFTELLAKEYVRYDDLPLQCPDGRKVDVEFVSNVYTVDHRKIIQCNIRDITEMKLMRAQVAQSDRLATMGMLAAGVAHEINNPLSYVLYNLESMTDYLPKLSSALRKCLNIVGERVGNEELASLMGKDQDLLNPSMFDNIQARFRDALHGSHRIKEVVRGLGTFSRMERDRMAPVALRPVIDVALDMAFNEIKYRARLVKEYGQTSTVLANDGRLSQVFLNLLINAAHSITEGDFEHNEIRVRTWQDGDEVCAEVRDTGGGISKEHIRHLFEPFFTTKAIGVGTGLGLSISKTIVEEYGGRIEVESEVGKGTRFVVRLPFNRAASEDETSQGDQVVQSGVRGRILVVDDEAGIRRAMVHMLREHDVVEAATGDDARKLLEVDQAFDLILCDMIMPLTSGADLHEWLSTTHPALDKQFVFVTGGAFTPKTRDYLTKVSNLRFEKPFDVANFKKSVSELIVANRSQES